MKSGALAATSSAAVRSTRVTSGAARGATGGGINGDKPRPSPLRLAILDPLEELLGELQVAERALGVDVVQERRLAVAGRFGQPDVARNHRAKNLLAEVLARLAGHLHREVVPHVVHRENQP